MDWDEQKPRPAKAVTLGEDLRTLSISELDQRLAELAHRVGVELTHGAAQRVRGGLLDVDLEHETSRAGCALGAL